MLRITTETRVPNKFGAGKDGFTDGSAVGGIAATDMEAQWFDHVQEEMAGLVESAGMVLDPLDRTQVQKAIAMLMAGRLINVRVLDTPGASIPVYDARTKFVIVEVEGAGGGTGGFPATTASQVGLCGGGGGGAYAMMRFTTGFIGQTVTIGAGGIAGASGSINSGGVGGTTSFGSLLSASGGLGATSSVIPNTSDGYTISGASGGTVTGTFLMAGSGDVGGHAIYLTNGNQTSGGNGGRGGRGLGRGGTPGGNAPGSGGGGGGGYSRPASSPATAGTVGAVGRMTLWEYAG